MTRSAPLPGYRPSRHLLPQLESAIDRYFEVEAEITADMQRRHDEHKARLAAAGTRIDRFLAQQGGSNHG